MSEPDRAAYEAAEKLVREAQVRAEEAAREATSNLPPNGWSTGAPPPSSSPFPDLSALIAMVDGLRGHLPPELARQLSDALRELLIAIRAVLDFTIERLDAPGVRRARGGGHPDPMSSRLAGVSKEMQLAALAAIALAVSMVLPWYQKSVPQQGKIVQGNVSALGVFTFVEAAILLVAFAVLFLVWARSQKKAFHLPGGDGVAITIAGGWAVLLLVLADVRPARGPGRRRRPRHPVGPVRGADLRRRADRRGRARARGRMRPSRRTRPRTTSTGSLPPPRGERDRRPDRRPRDATAVTEMFRDRPSWEGEAHDPGEERTTRLADERTTRLPDSVGRAHHPPARPAGRAHLAALRRSVPRGHHAAAGRRLVRGRGPAASAAPRITHRSGTTTRPLNRRPRRDPLIGRTSVDRALQVLRRSADDGGVNLSAASIYQIDERGLELRRSYMRMTPAEFELLSGMQAWADRNADAIGKALAEHTFTRRSRRRFPARVREQQGHAHRRPQEGLGLRPGRPLQGHLRRGRQPPAASASSTSRGSSGSARCTARSTCR